jgi:hypothetical protein
MSGQVTLGVSEGPERHWRTTQRLGGTVRQKGFGEHFIFISIIQNLFLVREKIFEQKHLKILH